MLIDVHPIRSLMCSRPGHMNTPENLCLTSGQESCIVFDGATLGSSSGLGHRPLTAVTGVRLPYRVPSKVDIFDTAGIETINLFLLYTRKSIYHAGYEVNTMSDVISDSVCKLSAITDQTPIDWDAFDSVLKGLEDINAYDEQAEETILSEFILDGNFYKRGFILADVVRHFLACGYDVSANDGLNGGLALHSLCCSSYDHYILEAAKVLMNAGAPVKYRTSDDDPNKEPEGLLGCIGWNLAGAWAVYKDYAWANILEAYYAMTEANIAGKDYNAIDNCFACIGKTLTSVSAINVGGKPALYDEGAISVFPEPLILWFGDKPLVASCYTDFVVNPVYADDKMNDLADVTTAFSSLVGTTLKEMQYIGATICYFEFSNGKRLFFASRDIGDRKRVGTFDILADSKK